MPTNSSSRLLKYFTASSSSSSFCANTGSSGRVDSMCFSDWFSGSLSRSALNISFFVSSSTSLPSSALATKSISATESSFLRSRSPPRSPSRNAVVIFLLIRSTAAGGILLPSIATPLRMPFLSKLITSALPSTTIISSLVATSGPHARPLIVTTSQVLTDSFIMSASFCESCIPVLSIIARRISFALSITYLRFCERTSSTLMTSTSASHGPTLSIVSSDDAISAVSLASSDDGIIISAKARPLFVFTFTSILPILPVCCSSRRSSSLPSRPSV